MLPKLADGVDLTCDLLMKLSGQGCVYVRLLQHYDSEVEESNDNIMGIFADEDVESIN